MNFMPKASSLFIKEQHGDSKTKSNLLFFKYIFSNTTNLISLQCLHECYFKVLNFVLLREGFGAKIEQCSGILSRNAGLIISVADSLFQVNDFHCIEIYCFFSIVKEF